jgi:hypothetical protein
MSIAERRALMRLFTLPVLCVLLLLAGCSRSKMKMVKRDYHGHFTSVAGGFYMHVPDNWEIRENLQGQVVVARSLPENSHEFRENITVRQPVPGVNATDARDQAVAELSKGFPDAKSSSFKEVGRGDGPDGSKFVSYTYTIDGDNLWARSYFYPASPGLVMLTCTTTAARAAVWTPQFEKIVSDFKLGSDPSPEPTEDVVANVTTSATPSPTASPK